MDPRDARLTLGPVLFHWDAERLRDFWFRIADEAPVDTVHLGEVVCSKRAPFLAPVLPEVAERLQAAGKEVVFSTLALVMSEREVAAIRELAADETMLVEANDLSAVALLAGRPHVLGPFVNVYNEGALAALRRHGAIRACLPVELPEAALATLAAVDGVEAEVFAFGRLPLALSARCYHARAHGRHKDDCRFVCGEDPDGLAVETLDGAAFLAVNGVQTLSHGCCSLVHALRRLAGRGIGRFRLSPQDCDMVAVARLFRAVLDGETEPGAAEESLAALFPQAPFADGYLHGREGAAWIGGAA